VKRRGCDHMNVEPTEELTNLVSKEDSTNKRKKIEKKKSLFIFTVL
jgi:hypothetical protein